MLDLALLKTSPAYAAMLQAEWSLLETLLAEKPFPIRGNADVGDIRDRLDSIAAIHKAWTAYAKTIIADLNYSISVTGGVETTDFVNQMSDALADLRGNAQAAANAMADSERVQAEQLFEDA